MLEQIFYATYQVHCLPTETNSCITKLRYLRGEWPENSCARWLSPSLGRCAEPWALDRLNRWALTRQDRDRRGLLG